MVRTSTSASRKQINELFMHLIYYKVVHTYNNIREAGARHAQEAQVSVSRIYYQLCILEESLVGIV